MTAISGWDAPADEDLRAAGGCERPRRRTGQGRRRGRGLVEGRPFAHAVDRRHLEVVLGAVGEAGDGESGARGAIQEGLTPDEVPS